MGASAGASSAYNADSVLAGLQDLSQARARAHYFCFFLAFFAVPYFLCAPFSQVARFCFDLSRLHSFNAFASFWARVSGFDFGFTTAAGVGVTFPEPLKVWLEGEPKTAGCGADAARQASAVPHGGGVAAASGAHGAASEQTCAS
jgi:hypothetical protein